MANPPEQSFSAWLKDELASSRKHCFFPIKDCDAIRGHLRSKQTPSVAAASVAAPRPRRGGGRGAVATVQKPPKKSEYLEGTQMTARWVDETFRLVPSDEGDLLCMMRVRKKWPCLVPVVPAEELEALFTKAHEDKVHPGYEPVWLEVRQAVCGSWIAQRCWVAAAAVFLGMPARITHDQPRSSAWSRSWRMPTPPTCASTCALVRTASMAWRASLVRLSRCSLAAAPCAPPSGPSSPPSGPPRVPSARTPPSTCGRYVGQPVRVWVLVSSPALNPFAPAVNPFAHERPPPRANRPSTLPTHAPPLPSPPPSPPLSLRQMDLTDLASHRHKKYRYVLIITCRFTKHVWLRPLAKKSSKAIALAVRTAGHV